MPGELRSWFARFTFALLGVAAATAVAFFRHLEQLYEQAPQIVAVGLLLAAMLATIRIGWYGRALAIAMLLVPLRLSLTRLPASAGEVPTQALASAVAPMHALPGSVRELAADLFGGLALGLGLFAIALVYDALARRGWRFGKFLVLGPLLGVLQVAMVPMQQTLEMVPSVSFTQLLTAFYVGVVVGDGAGFGAEVFELTIEPEVEPEEEAA